MRTGLRRVLPWVLLVVGVVFGVLAERTQQLAGRSWPVMIADILGGWAFLVAGMLVWGRRPGNRCWWLLMAAGISWFVGTLWATADEVVSLIGFAFGGWHYLFMVWVLLAFPTGLVPLLRDRILLGVLVVLSTVRTLGRLFLFVPPDGTGCDCAPNRFLPITDPMWFDAAESLYMWGYTATILLALISVAVRWSGSSRPGRRMLAPVLSAGTAVLAGQAYDRLNQSHEIVDVLTQEGMFYVLVLLRVIAAAAFVFGLWRLKGSRSAVADLVADLGPDAASPAPLEAALRRALGDPTLVLLPWSPAAGGYVDDHEQAVALPVDDGRRAITRIERRGVPVAALVHDPALLEDPGLINGVVAAVRLTADNERLRDEVDRQLVEVAASRSRILDAGDAERRRIERDLHDGAQQRLVTIGLALRLTEARLGKDADPQMRSDLVQAVKDLGEAIDELRDLAQGIHPSILTEAGLAAALESLADRAPVPVHLQVDLPDDVAPPIAATAYFAVAEALTNIAKHARAATVEVLASSRGDRVEIVVVDDGVGGASESAFGSGLRGIADRVAAVGGSMRVHSPAGGGTRLELSLPCE